MVVERRSKFLRGLRLRSSSFLSCAIAPPLESRRHARATSTQNVRLDPTNQRIMSWTLLAAGRPGCHALSPCTVSSDLDDSDKGRRQSFPEKSAPLFSGNYALCCTRRVDTHESVRGI